MSKLRDQLGHARQAYERKRYPGDLAADLFARLDAGEPLDAARSQDAGADADVSSPIRPADVDAVRGRWWRPLLAIAAAVAVVATSVVTLRMTDTPRPGTGGVATTNDPQTPSKTDPTPAVDPTSELLAAATTDDDATDVAADFSVVPAYQSFAIGVPTSISLASLEEYERQAQEQQSTSDDTSTVQ